MCVLVVRSVLQTHAERIETLCVSFCYLSSKCSISYKINIPCSFFKLCSSQTALPLVSSSIPVSLLCKWQLSEVTVTCWCHVNQIRCHNRKSVHTQGGSAVTRHMTYNHCKPNAGRVVTDTLTWICSGSKVAAPSHSCLDMTANLRSALIGRQETWTLNDKTEYIYLLE